MKAFRHVVVATDFSADSEAALKRAVAFCQSWGSELTVVHAVGRPPETLDNASGAATLAQFYKLSVQHAKRELAEVQEKAAAALGRAVGCEIIAKAPVAALRDYVAEHSCGLLILGARGQSETDSVFVIGSVSEGVVQKCGTNVLIVRGEARDSLYEHLLVASDLSPGSRGMGEVALMFLGEGQLTMSSVIPPRPTSDAVDSRAIDRAWTEIHSQAFDALQDLSPIVLDGQADFRVDEGKPARTICATADALHADLIVVGKRAHRPPETASVSARVVRHAEQSVLVLSRWDD